MNKYGEVCVVLHNMAERDSQSCPIVQLCGRRPKLRHSQDELNLERTSTGDGNGCFGLLGFLFSVSQHCCDSELSWK